MTVQNNIKQLDLESRDLIEDRVGQLKRLFPEVVTEGSGSVDFEKLRLLLGDEVDENDERYAFTWPGKTDAIRQAQTVSSATLRPCFEKSVNWDTTKNLYIEGDNLEVLKLLQRGYHGKVKMIFIDPPYNTGHDFVYKDSFGDSVENYREQAGLAGQSNADTSGRYHSNWCSMMYPRLKLARELLSDDGVMILSIDHVEFANLKKILDEIFGESCFAAHVAWRSSDNSNNNALVFSEDFNDLFIYSKSPDWKPNFLNDPEKRKHFKNPDNDPRGPWFDGNPVNNPGLRPNLQFDITTPSGKIIKHPANGWRWSKESMKQKFKTGELRFSPDETRVIRRTYLADMEGLPPSTLWIDLEKTGHTRGAKYELKALFPELPVTDLFSTPKPTKLIRYILDIATDNDSLVMDFFSGSATTAHAVIAENEALGCCRRFILVQLPEPTQGKFHNICDAGEERIRRAGQKIAQEVEKSNRQLKLGEEPQKVPDIGFRVLKLDDSGIAQPESGQLLLNRIKSDLTDEDIIFEMMLKWGIDLTSSIKKLKLGGGYPCYSVSEGELVCCLADGLSIGDIQEIADMQPSRVLMLDSILDDTLKLNAVQIFKHAEEKNQITIDLRTV